AGGVGGAGGAQNASGTNASGVNMASKSAGDLSAATRAEVKTLVRRLVFSSAFLLVLMYFSMAHMMWNAPIPAFFAGNPVALGLLQMILAAIVMVINKKFFINGFKSLSHLSPNMDTLVALGSGVSFVYSTVVLFKMTGAVASSDEQTVHQCMKNLYFESAAMIVTLITIGKMLEAISKGRTTDALKNLMKLAPKTALILRDGKEVELGIEQVSVGDVFIVKPGMSIPVDGVIIEGESALDESSLTGESIPVDKKIDDKVFAGTINNSGFLKCRSEKVGSDTTIAQIIQLVSDAASTKAPIARIADKVSLVFVPTIIGLAIITFIVWLLAGAQFAFALSRAIAVLVVSCPCALGLATPVAIMVGNGVGAKNGILFKTSSALEQTGKTKFVLLDKTGTITNGTPEVTDIISLAPGKFDEKSLLQIAATVESKSEHPLGKAIVKKCEKDGIKILDSTDFASHAGNGLESTVNQKKYYCGKTEYILSVAKNLSEKEIENLRQKTDELAVSGKTPVIVAKSDLDGQNASVIGLIALADTVKPESEEAVAKLHDMGLTVVMLTGDNEITARAIASQVGVDKVIANVLPSGKEQVVRDFMAKGQVAMVGDGVNDAPALTRANIGIAIGAGSDVALDCADVVLVKSRLDDVPAAIRLSRKTLLNIKENLFWAFFYNVALIPIAAGCYYHAFGLQMNPMLGAAAMSLSSFCVVMNALRLNLSKVHVKAKYKKFIPMEDSEKMEKTLKVEGMMCSHCEARVKEALEKLKGVESASPDHENNIVKVSLSKDVKDKDFEKTITKAGYKFLGIEG
ncbi:MAG: heavy metal translocating P-type ATPase, partial [Treponemataceae bacterium]|nr:heavy metal translocating P-type ATPase [Treponemataceae bacterium]